MPVTNYYTINGKIIGEKTTGGSRVDYLTDALGSVIGTVNQSGQVVNTYRYKPYGALLAKTGTGPDPAFGWVGSPGYRQTGRKFSDEYVGARHYDATNGRWTTPDPLGRDEEELAYCYVGNEPIDWADPSGLQKNKKIGMPPKKKVPPRKPPKPSYPDIPDPWKACIVDGLDMFCSGWIKNNKNNTDDIYASLRCIVRCESVTDDPNAQGNTVARIGDWVGRCLGLMQICPNPDGCARCRRIGAAICDKKNNPTWWCDPARNILCGIKTLCSQCPQLNHGGKIEDCSGIYNAIDSDCFRRCKKLYKWKKPNKAKCQNGMPNCPDLRSIDAFIA